MTTESPGATTPARPGPLPRNTAYDTGYRDHYVRLGGTRGRLTSFDPLGPGLAAGDGAPGGMIDHDHAAGRPSRREKELAAWLTTDVPDELRAAQFDIATLLAKIEELRDALWMSTRNMIEAGHRAYEAEREGALGELAARYATLTLAAAALEHENAILRAAAGICNRDHCGRPGHETSATADRTGQPPPPCRTTMRYRACTARVPTRPAASTARPT